MEKHTFYLTKSGLEPNPVKIQGEYNSSNGTLTIKVPSFKYNVNVSANNVGTSNEFIPLRLELTNYVSTQNLNQTIYASATYYKQHYTGVTFEYSHADVILETPPPSISSSGKSTPRSTRMVMRVFVTLHSSKLGYGTTLTVDYQPFTVTLSVQKI